MSALRGIDPKADIVRRIWRTPFKNGPFHCSQSLAFSPLSFARDELLPLIHLSWKSLRVLFSSDNLFMVDRAFWVLRTFAVTARDFIHRRTLTDVFPSLLGYIRRLQVSAPDILSIAQSDPHQMRQEPVGNLSSEHLLTESAILVEL